MIDLHHVIPGALVAVAHPDPEYGLIHILSGESAPTPSQKLTTDFVADAADLPKRQATGVTTRRWVVGAAFAVGLIGAPFLATPHPWQYAVHLIGGNEGSVARLDHPYLFEADELLKSLEGMATELGHEEVRSIVVTDVRFTAEVPASPDSLHIDRVTVQDYETIEREPHELLASEFTEEVVGGRFLVSDVDWEAGLNRVSEAAELSKAQGLTHPKLHAISVQRDTSPLAPIEVRLDFRDDYTYGQVFLNALGELAATEEFLLLPEADRASYFYDAERFAAAVQAMLDEVGADEIIEIGNYGDRLYLDVYIDSGSGVGQRVSVAHREGRIAEVEAPEAAKVAPDDRFRLGDFDWASVYGGISVGQQIMAEAGAAGTEPTHILIRRDSTHSREGNESYARIYLRNAYDESGYVVVYGDGSIGRVTGP